MKHAKHTPGPWQTDQWGERVHAGNYSHGTQVHVCNVFSPTPIGPIPSTYYSADFKDARLANARLIAAAPELLEFIQNIESIVSRIRRCALVGNITDRILTDLDASAFDLIKKATGGAE